MKLSTCILVHQWHPKLPEVISAVESFSSEVLLGINGNFHPDNHPELYQFQKLKTFRLLWKGYGMTKNELAKQAVNDWILSLDADEVIDEHLKIAIENLDDSDEKKMYRFRMTHFLGEKPLLYGAWGKGKKHFLRLYNRNFTSWNTNAVHESIIQPKDAILISLQGKVHHYTAESFDQFMKKNFHYAQLSAEKYRKEGRDISPFRKYISSGFNFLKEYFFLLGFLDGKTGWQVAKGNALYTYWKYDFLHKNIKKLRRKPK